MKRRDFLQNGLGFVSLGLTMPTLFMQATRALADEPSIIGAAGGPTGKKGDKILVVLEMAGGNDGLNTVMPLGDPMYAKLRPTIGVNLADAVKIDHGLGMHPGMTAFGKLFESGKLGVITGVGYPNPNRSHFQSMDIWQSGNTNAAATERTGWLARYFDEDGHLTGDPLAGVSLGGNLPLALWSQTSPASVIGNGQDFGFVARNGGGAAQAKTLRTLYQSGTVQGGTVAAGPRDFVRNVGNEVYASTDAIKAALRAYDVKAGQKAQYPNNGLANGLQTIAKLIAGGLSTRVYYLSMGGFDTHANQPGQHATLLANLANSISAFMADLALQGRADDVLVMTFSEFGRRVQENGSAGTDHGTASVMFVAGGGVRGGVYGDYPSLNDLDAGDLRYHTDFRSVYATVLGSWLNSQPAKVLGGDYAPLKFV